MNRSPLLLTLLSLGIATSVVLIASCLPEPHELVGRPCDAEHGCEDAELTCCRGTCQLASEVPVCEGPGGTDGGMDGGSVDGGSTDGGGGDGGTLPDAGPGDGGAGDGGTGMVDGGSPLDAGCPPNLLPAGGFEQAVEVNDYAETGAGRLSRSSARVRTGTGALQVQRDTSQSDDFFGAQLSENLLASKVRVGPTYCVAAWMNRGSVAGELRLYPRRFSSSGYDSSLDTRGDKQTLTDDAWHLFLYGISLNATYNYSINFRTSADTADGTAYYVDDVRVWESLDGGCESRCAP
ncbi:hypothetical protein [Hyalangium gracile]|uniref:hypothetical protein n=1 Tax=Hyalangium gracile TaxID=394092 RepID=UPI001CCC9D2C|nr:hypothetical protein [Hyalangium gracile]